MREDNSGDDALGDKSGGSTYHVGFDVLLVVLHLVQSQLHAHSSSV